MRVERMRWPQGPCPRPRTEDEFTGLKADEIVRKWLPRFRAEALGRP